MQDHNDHIVVMQNRVYQFTKWFKKEEEILNWYNILKEKGMNVGIVRMPFMEVGRTYRMRYSVWIQSDLYGTKEVKKETPSIRMELVRSAGHFRTRWMELGGRANGKGARR